MKNFTSLENLLTAFPTDTDCRRYLSEIRWAGKVVCPHCNNKDKKIYVYKNERLYKCASCKKQFTSTVGTTFERSHVGLKKWFVAIYIFSSHKKGISSHQLSKDIKVTQPTAWYMLHRIRSAMNNNKTFKGILSGVVEVDETFIGGKAKNKHKSKRKKGTQGRSTLDKTPVLGMVQRGGNVITFPIKKLDGAGMKLIIRKKVDPNTIVMTDSFKGYNGLGKHLTHNVINHSEGEYVNGNIHTQTIEGFWSQLKKGLIGIYHWVSPKHLYRYCDEFEYRYNTRSMKEVDRFNLLLGQSFNTRLLFVDLIRNTG
ncbi:MAG: IS1595 family transposase [Cytophaga sp.]|uniref:IS1595 family transposase n=1 Tax=Cytophaga sp. TaxID=29535 RepID=UPI003F80EF0F